MEENALTEVDVCIPVAEDAKRLHAVRSSSSEARPVLRAHREARVGSHRNCFQCRGLMRQTTRSKQASHASVFYFIFHANNYFMPNMADKRFEIRGSCRKCLLHLTQPNVHGDGEKMVLHTRPNGQRCSFDFECRIRFPGVKKECPQGFFGILGFAGCCMQPHMYPHASETLRKAMREV